MKIRLSTFTICCFAMLFVTGCEEELRNETRIQDNQVLDSTHFDIAPHLDIGEKSFEMKVQYDTLRWYEVVEGDTNWHETITPSKFWSEKKKLVDFGDELFATLWGNGHLLDTNAMRFEEIKAGWFMGEISSTDFSSLFGKDIRLISSDGEFNISHLGMDYYTDGPICAEATSTVTSIGKAVEKATACRAQFVVLEYAKGKNEQGKIVHVHPSICWKILDKN